WAGGFLMSDSPPRVLAGCAAVRVAIIASCKDARGKRPRKRRVPNLLFGGGIECYRNRRFARKSGTHGPHHLHRRFAASCPAPGPTGVLRLCRPRLLFGADLAREPRRPAAAEAAPARAG